MQANAHAEPNSQQPKHGRCQFALLTNPLQTTQQRTRNIRVCTRTLPFSVKQCLQRERQTAKRNRKKTFETKTTDSFSVTFHWPNTLSHPRLSASNLSCLACRSDAVNSFIISTLIGSIGPGRSAGGAPGLVDAPLPLTLRVTWGSWTCAW
jgi:hypothetical protein